MGDNVLHIGKFLIDLPVDKCTSFADEFCLQTLLDEGTDCGII